MYKFVPDLHQVCIGKFNIRSIIKIYEILQYILLEKYIPNSISMLDIPDPIILAGNMQPSSKIYARNWEYPLDA